MKWRKRKKKKKKKNRSHSPVVNWGHTPAHRLTKFFTSLLNKLINLPNTILRTPPKLINDLSEINIHSDVGLASVSNSNMHSNITYL